ASPARRAAPPSRNPHDRWRLRGSAPVASPPRLPVRGRRGTGETLHPFAPPWHPRHGGASRAGPDLALAWGSTPHLRRAMITTATSTDVLWRRWRDDDDADARRELLARYIGLVHHAAREVAPRVRDAVSLEELFSAGSLGLLQAMEGFDLDRKLAFSTFAMRRIRGAILDELRARDPLSRADRAHVRRLDQAVADLEQRLGRAPLSDE